MQITRRGDYAYKFQITATIAFHQKGLRGKWFFTGLQKVLFGIGSIDDKKNGKREYCITGYDEVKGLAILLLPFLHLKRKQAKYLIDILNMLDSVKTPQDFIVVCKKSDRFGQLNDSKNRTVTSQTVIQHFKTSKVTLNTPVKVKKKSKSKDTY